MIYHLTPVKWLLLKRQKINAAMDAERGKCSYTVGGYKLISHYGRLWRFLKKLKIESSIPLLGICPKEKKKKKGNINREMTPFEMFSESYLCQDGRGKCKANVLF